jgi:hypothetical protein
MFRKPYHLCPPKQPEKCGPGSDPKKKLWLNQNFIAGMVSVIFVRFLRVRRLVMMDYFFLERITLIVCPKNERRSASRKKSLLDFFEMEWKDWAESVPFLRFQGREARGVKSTGKEVSISKVSANYTYPNIFGLRRHKFGMMKQIVEAVPRNVRFVHLKELERSPEMFIQGLVREFGLTVRDGYEPQPPSKVAHTTGKSRCVVCFRSCRHSHVFRSVVRA